jgi:anti-sigma factor RsiW
MRCKKVKEKLSAFIDKELDREKILEIEQHLAECSECNQELNLLIQAWNALEVLEKIEPSDNFEDRFWQRVRETRLRQPLFQKLSRKLLPAPVVVIILVIGLLGGIYFGNILYPKQTKIKENFLNLDSFDDLPPESVGGIYFALVSKTNNFRE